MKENYPTCDHYTLQNIQWLDDARRYWPLKQCWGFLNFTCLFVFFFTSQLKRNKIADRNQLPDFKLPLLCFENWFQMFLTRFWIIRGQHLLKIYQPPDVPQSKMVTQVIHIILKALVNLHRPIVETVPARFIQEILISYVSPSFL